jgi:hypothetical protein
VHLFEVQVLLYKSVFLSSEMERDSDVVVITTADFNKSVEGCKETVLRLRTPKKHVEK